ncbi:MAG: FlgD immunoglobulin-like domain containing protein [Ignavibacteriaceae bacterium]
MKNFLSTTPILAVIFMLFCMPVLFAQPAPVVGDYGAVTSGNWSSLSTWKQWDGTGFNTVTTGTPGSSKQVFILSGATVTLDSTLSNSSNCKNLIVQSGATLQSDKTLPIGGLTVLKINGPTIWIGGNLGKDSTDAFTIETKYNGTITLSGSGVVNIAELRPNSSQSGTLTFIFALGANINYAGSDGLGGAGIYTYRGTQTSATITVNPGVTVNFAKNSNLMTSATPGALGKMTTILNVNGTMNLTTGSAIFSDSAGYSFTANIGNTGVLNIGKNLTPWISGVNNDGAVASINVASGGKLNILNGGTADFTNSSATITGTGAFALNSGATINIGATSGLDAINGPVRTTTATFDTAANYNYVGTGAQSPGALLPATVNNYSVGVNSVDTLNSAITTKGTLSINGTLVNNGGITSNGTAAVNGIYQHNLNGGAIPIATWGTGSTCLITGTTTGNSNNATTGANQNFYNFTVNCPNLTQPSIPCHFDMASNTIAGNVTFKNTNGKYYALTGFEVSGTKTITVNGNFSLDSTLAFVAIDDYSSKHAVETVKLIVKGNVSVTGAFGLSVGSSPNLNNLIVLGNVNLQAGSQFYSHSGTSDSVIFAGSSVQNYTAGALNNGNHISFLVQSGSVVKMDTSAFQGSSSTFTLNAGATLETADTLGLNGNITVGGTTSLSTGANYQFNGSLAQVTGALLPATVSSLTINNSKGITLSGNTTVDNNLTLTNGTLKTTSSSLLTLVSGASIIGASGTNYVNGPLAFMVASTNPSTLTYPIGKDSIYRPVVLSVTQDSTKSTTYTGELFNSTPTVTSLAPTLGQISTVRYYKVTKSAGANVTSDNIKLSYGTDDNVTDPSKISIAESDTSGNWIDLGGIGTTATTGTITSLNKFSTFNNFAIASKLLAAGPSLASPIAGATNQDTTLKLSWNLLSNAQSYILEVAIDSTFSNIVQNDTVNTDTSKQISNLGFGMKYFWRVSGLELGKQTQWSQAWSFATFLPAPDSLLTSMYQTKNVQLTWKNNLTNLSGFEIQRKTGSAGTYTTIDTAKSSATSYIDSTVQSGQTYVYKVRSFNTFAASNFSNESMILVTITGITNTGLKPLTFALQQNYPNPFNPSTQIEYSIPRQANVTIKIYNILGREIKTLVSGEKTAGEYSITWNGLDNSGNQVASGAYFYRIEAGSFIQIKKMIFLK